MRTLTTSVAIVIAIAIVLLITPGIVPQPAREALLQTQGHLAGAFAQASEFTGRTIAWRPFGVTPAWVLLAGIAGLGALAAVLLRVGRGKASVGGPSWLTAARSLARATSDSRARLEQCRQIEKKLVADMKRRGEAALARAHQLDLYGRFVTREKFTAQPVNGAALERWRNATRQTLDSLTVTPAARTTATFHQMRPALWALDAGDARALDVYYDQLSALFGEHEKAWNTAREAADKPVMDQALLLEAMERMRQINRAIAKDTATLIGDLEISVRALS